MSFIFCETAIVSPGKIVSFIMKVEINFPVVNGLPLYSEIGIALVFSFEPEFAILR